MVKIAVVDDSSADRRRVVELLDRLGIESVEFFSAIEAIPAIGEGEFAAAIIDDVMPGLTGYKACQYIAAEAKNGNAEGCPVVMHGSKSQDADKWLAYKSGALGWSPKSNGDKGLEAELRKIPALMAAMEAAILEKAAGQAKRQKSAKHASL